MVNLRWVMFSTNHMLNSTAENSCGLDTCIDKHANLHVYNLSKMNTENAYNDIRWPFGISAFLCFNYTAEKETVPVTASDYLECIYPYGYASLLHVLCRVNTRSNDRWTQQC